MTILARIESLLGDSDNVATRAYVSSLVVRTAPARLRGLTGFSSKTSAQWIHIFDRSNLPADGAIPDVVLYVGGTSGFSLEYNVARKFKNGIVIANSTTGPTLTIGAADIWLDVQVSNG